MAKESDTLYRILESSTELFVQQGYRGLSMREIAESVGLSKPALYHHFKDKETLFLAVLGHHLETFGQLVLTAQKQQGAYKQLKNFLTSFFALPVTTRRVITLSSQEMGHLSVENRQVFGKRYHQDFLHPLENILQDALKNKEIRSVDTTTVLRMFLGLVFPFVASPSSEGKALSKSILDTFWHGIGKE